MNDIGNAVTMWKNDQFPMLLSKVLIQQYVLGISYSGMYSNSVWAKIWKNKLHKSYQVAMMDGA